MSLGNPVLEQLYRKKLSWLTNLKYFKEITTLLKTYTFGIEI